MSAHGKFDYENNLFLTTQFVFSRVSIWHPKTWARCQYNGCPYSLPGDAQLTLDAHLAAETSVFERSRISGGPHGTKCSSQVTVTCNFELKRANLDLENLSAFTLKAFCVEVISQYQTYSNEQHTVARFLTLSEPDIIRRVGTRITKDPHSHLL
jgi:hypothetical protein